MATAETEFIRLELDVRDQTGRIGLQFAVADPAWMLGRQWQFGEFAGEDAGSPASAVMWTRTSRLTRFLPKLPDGTAGVRITDPHLPLEARLENEHQPRSEADARLAALAGVWYQRRLAVVPQTTGLTRYRRDLQTRYPLVLPASVAEGRDPLLEVAAGRALDGQQLIADLRPAVAAGSLPPQPAVDAADRSAVLQAAQELIAWHDDVTGRRLADSTAWVPDRMEYQASVSAPTSGGETVFAAAEYDSGILDWDQFDVAPGAALGAAADGPPPAAQRQEFLPSAVSFAGMPVPRLWEFEESAVDLGEIEANPEDVAAMLVAEFALRFGNDFFLVPLPLQAGAVHWTEALIVADTFGRRFRIDHASQDGFRVFEHTGAGVPPAGLSPPLVVFPTAVGLLESEPREQIALLLDEAANLRWAVERRALDALGAPADRDEAAARSRPAPPAPAPSPREPDGQRTLRYVARTPLQPHWFPLLPDAPGSERLRLARVAALPGETVQPAPLGRVLAELAATTMPVEELTRAGKEVLRTWQYARGSDGTQHLWMGRRVRSARPAASPSVRFDELAGRNGGA
jgi:hypothetical protein